MRKLCYILTHITGDEWAGFDDVGHSLAEFLRRVVIEFQYSKPIWYEVALPLITLMSSIEENGLSYLVRNFFCRRIGFAISE